ncbi:MAG: 4Fe-4S binding protein [Gammaproteobacteria bacterium]
MNVATTSLDHEASPDARNRAARAAVLGAFTTAASASHTVEYLSRGHLLIIGSPNRVLAAAEELREMARVTLLFNDGAETPQTPVSAKCFSAPLARLTGHLGRYSAIVLRDDQEEDLGRLEGVGYYDVVLDLGREPAIGAELPPPGYFRPHDQDSYREAVEQIRGLQGEFEKPRYVRLDPDRCAHSASGLVGCTRCLSVCPADAIQSVNERIEVNVHLCHGVGACTTVCPTAALSYDYPNRQTTLTRLRSLLRGYRERGGEGALLLIHDARDGERWREADERAFPGRILPFEVEELASAGMDLWLSALAYGASEVALLGRADQPVGARVALDEELAVARDLLGGLGHPPDRLRLVYWEDLAAITERSLLAPDPEPATHAALEEKRDAIDLAIEHLARQGAPRGEAIELPRGAPFGSVLVSDACTLCMACVSVCPTNALQGGEESPRLGFVERPCVQCGLCQHACPEQAVTLAPRYLLDRDQRQAPRLLREEEPARCLDCGKAFAPQSSIRRLREQLTGHPMFAGEGARRLELCDECRVKDILRASGQG